MGFAYLPFTIIIAGAFSMLRKKWSKASDLVGFKAFLRERKIGLSTNLHKGRGGRAPDCRCFVFLTRNTNVR